jgi:hypothetical protein
LEEERISWHPAFLQALQLECEPYLDALRFEAEHQLTAEPLKIDVLITKEPDAVVDNPIARIFRRFNLWEFKSPADPLPVHVFFKVFAYIGQFVSLNKLDPEEVSFSFVVTRHPQSVMEFLRRKGRVITRREPGIYLVEGMDFALQIIETKRLAPENNLFLGSLRTGLHEEQVRRILKETEGNKHRVAMDAYLDVLWRANLDSFMEVTKQMGDVIEQSLRELGWIDRWEKQGMRKAIELLKNGQSPVENLTVEQVLQETGLVDRVEKQKAVKIARRLIKEGWDSEKIAEATDLDRAAVESLITEGEKNA